jgi:hypothetical protein
MDRHWKPYKGQTVSPLPPDPPSPSEAAGGDPGANEGETAEPVIVRSALEFQRAHDLLVSLMFDPAIRRKVQVDRTHLAIAADVLCWALGHEYNTNFEENLLNLGALLRARGFREHDSGKLQVTEYDRS